ncbi:GDSL esterase/lipase-like [Dorcoceras hygrometricum]|uniref:GDSL esterase/lipase-like n=1 Tax=Dorcoceras hygrometricum TaxID=472368 RepID=A0A2Z7CCP2_9LAMI|nr:GDSL esterase/lipase-like [Dorcoceras hygrometricum]
MMSLTVNIALSCLILLFTSSFEGAIPTAASKVPAIIVFGDSSVDSGNNNRISTVLKSNFRPYGRDFYGGRPTGRFSNGRIPPDFISEKFGLKPYVPAYLDPSYNVSDFATGVCFASAGTGFDNATSNVLFIIHRLPFMKHMDFHKSAMQNVIPLWKQVEYYKYYKETLKSYIGDKKSEYVIREALYIISLGTNDFLENYYSLSTNTRSRYSLDQYQDFLIDISERFVKQIYHLGARKISLTGLPPMGCLPLERATNLINGHGGGCMNGYNGVALRFNAKLNGLVARMNEEMEGIRVVFSDPYGVFLQMIRNPSSFGFEVSSVACCATGMFEMGYLCDELNPFTCRDADKYVFWDSFHPTQKTSRIIVDNLIQNSLHQFL